MSPFSGLLLFMLAAGIAAQCPPNYEYLGGRCLMFLTDERYLDWAEAFVRCQSLNGSLAKIDDCWLLTEIANYIENVIGENGINAVDFWVDGSDQEEEMNFVFFDGTPMPLRAPFWGSTDTTSGLPDNEPVFGEGDDCVALSPLDGFYFHNEGCASEYAAICQQDETENGLCPPSYTQIDGGCYQFLASLSATWDEARAVCQANGAELAIIDDCDTFAAIARYLEGDVLSSSTYFWIGGVWENSWVWVDGSEMELGLPFWGQRGLDQIGPVHETFQNCVFLNSHFRYRFDHENCYWDKSLLCEAPVEDAVKNMA